MNNLDYCNHLYDDTTDGYLQIKQFASSRGEISIYNTDNASIREVILNLDKTKDTYITVNTHFVPKGTVNTIRQFRALYIDLDLNNKDKTETIYEIYDLVFDNVIPEPTMIVDSGRGLHIYWRIENAPYQALYTWQEIEDYLYYKLKKLGADIKATDGARILRIPSTINSKSSSECKVLHINDELKYSMYDLRKKYLNYKPKEKCKQLQFEQIKPIKSNVTYFYNSYTLHAQRAEDIRTLCKLRKYRVTGYRNAILHCYAYWLGITVRHKDSVEQSVIELNNAFSMPLKDNEINSILRCIYKVVDKFILYENLIRDGQLGKALKGSRDKSGYWYKNETLIELLDITAEEQKHLHTIIGKKEKYSRRRDKDKLYQRTKRRNNDALTPKQKEMKKLREKALVLRDEGNSIREIAKILGKSKSSIENILKTSKK